jgi:hypothetical protein
MTSHPLITFQNALNKVFDDVKYKNLQSFIEFLVQEEPTYNKEVLFEYIEKFKSVNVLPVICFTQKKKEKKTRPPNSYNLYIQRKMKEIKEANPELKGKDLMRRATTEWNIHKKTLLSEVKEISSS